MLKQKIGNGGDGRESFREQELWMRRVGIGEDERERLGKKEGWKKKVMKEEGMDEKGW